MQCQQPVSNALLARMELLFGGCSKPDQPTSPLHSFTAVQSAITHGEITHNILARMYVKSNLSSTAKDMFKIRDMRQ
jgi:hypothetical protein